LIGKAAEDGLDEKPTLKKACRVLFGQLVNEGSPGIVTREGYGLFTAQGANLF